MQEIKVKCPAKINLTLEILNKREDGFHNIQSVMQTISLFDILTIKLEKSDKFEIKLSGTSPDIPYDERNLVYKAAKLFFEAAFISSSPLVGEDRGEGVQDFPPEVKMKLQEEFHNWMRQRAKELRKNLTAAEDILWFYLRAKRFLGFKFKRQVPIGRYIADFVCFEQKLIIELDGSQHLQAKSIKDDLKRDEFFEVQNFKVLRFYNDEIYKNLEKVLETVYLGLTVFDYKRHLDCRDLLNYEPPLPQPLSRKGRGEKSSYKISIHIEKNIPIAAGLAGGSTDAAGTLWGLNQLFDNVLSDSELHELCAKLGSDLNFCLEGGCQLATSRGEILEKLPFKEFNVSLIKPKNIGISAKEAYTKFAQIKNKPNLNKTKDMVEALKQNNAGIEKLLYNDLELAVISDYSELQEIKNKYPQSIMSGSGSTFFGVNVDFKHFDDRYWVRNGLKSIATGVQVI